MVSEWREEKAKMEKEVQSLESRATEQTKKNDLLHKQLNQLNEQVKGSRRRASISSLDTSVSPDDESSLLELTTIMRRDQEIAESQRDLANSENIRLKQKVRNVEIQLEDAKKTLSELEALKAKPQITSDQHKELMEQVNQLNILRESNSVLRDEKNRISLELDIMKKKKNDLEVEIQPLRRKEADLMIVIEKKENEKTEIRESINKIKADHIEQIKKLNQTRISSDQMKKIVSEKDIWKKQHDTKAADLRAKENELSEQKQELHKVRQEMKTAMASAEEEKKKLQEENKTQKNQQTKLRELARKYKNLHEKQKETLANNPKPEYAFKYVQTDGVEDSPVASVEADTTAETNLMKKMMQNKIQKLEKTLEEKEKALDEETKKKEKILANARKKIKQLQAQVTESKANAGKPEAKPEPSVRPLPDGKATTDSKNVAEVNPHQREAPKAPPVRVVGTVAPTRVSDVPQEEPQISSTQNSAPVAVAQPSTPVSSVTTSTANVPVVTSTQQPVPVQPIFSSAPADSSPVSQAAPQESTFQAPSSSTAVSSTAPEETPESSEQALAMDADQLPEEASRIDENRTVSQPKVNKRAREPSSIDDEAAKRSKTEPPQNPEPVETIEIEDDPEPELVEDEVVEIPDDQDEAVPEVVEVEPEGEDMAEEEALNEPEMDEPEMEPPEIEIGEEQPVPDSSVQVPVQSRSIPPPLDHMRHLQQQRTIPSRIPTTPGIITAGNDDEDGCVPRTPTLLSGRGQHEGNQALVSPAPQLHQSGAVFSFFTHNQDNDHSVPGTSDGVSSTTETNPADH